MFYSGEKNLFIQCTTWMIFVTIFILHNGRQLLRIFQYTKKSPTISKLLKYSSYSLLYFWILKRYFVFEISDCLFSLLAIFWLKDFLEHLLIYSYILNEHYLSEHLRMCASCFDLILFYLSLLRIVLWGISIRLISLQVKVNYLTHKLLRLNVLCFMLIRHGV